MRRQNAYLLLLGLFLLILPIAKDGTFRLGVTEYFSSISRFTTLIFDPRFVTEPLTVKVLAGLYVIQFTGWVIFAITLMFVALSGIIRNRSTLKVAALLSVLVLVHGVLEVALSMSLTSLQFSEAVFSRFGIDFADFADDYDALFNSTLVPIGIILWFFVQKRKIGVAKSDNYIDENKNNTIDSSLL
ncbi:MAG: hypothetical protein ACO3P3_01460 [Candidatus Nanopelagicales bacterium]